MQDMPNVLVVEDNASLAEALTTALRAEYELDVAANGKKALYRADISDYDLVLLDLQLPDMHGLAVCQQLRERGCRAPILILSAETKVLSKINLLDAGANDYLTKPFSLGELKARLRALSRIMADTNEEIRHPASLFAGDIALNGRTCEVFRADIPINLRRKEFLLLECLMRNAGNAVSRQMLIQYAWRGEVQPWANTVDVHIKYLRDKIDRPFGAPLIKTIHGVGYKFAALPAEKAVRP